MLTVYGMGASQPSRAVWWLCLIQGLPFELCDVPQHAFGPDGPLAALNPTGQVPTIRDGDFALYEMPAILSYLCRKHGWEDFYPPDVETRAFIDQYLHFHHNRTRNVMVELMAPHSKPWTEPATASLRPSSNTARWAPSPQVDGVDILTRRASGAGVGAISVSCGRPRGGRWRRTR